MNEKFGRDFLVAPTVLSLKSFGSVQAEMEIPKTTKQMRILFKSRGASDGKPEINLTVTDGKKPKVVLYKQTVDRTFELEKDLRLEPGKYQVLIEYPTATKPEPRPALDIHHIEFL